MLARSIKSITLLSLIVAFSGVGGTLASSASASSAYNGPLPGTKCATRGPVIPRQTSKELVVPIGCVRAS